MTNSSRCLLPWDFDEVMVPSAFSAFRQRGPSYFGPGQPEIQLQRISGLGRAGRKKPRARNAARQTARVLSGR